MQLQKLEIQGFKSFAKKTTFLFPAADGLSKGVTAIVGPNGSGKSNVADAIRWVLGEQSMKALRSKKSEDVIFFGSDARSRLGFCEVSLFFDNSDRAFPLDYAEVVITRRLYRDGQGEYLVNRSKVRLSDITLLLAQAHFARESYSVIGQGMIDAIIHAQPHERKEYFDEAAGVRQYQIKKDASFGKLKATRENCTHVQLLIAELEPKIRFFSKQKKRLEERQSIADQYEALARRYYNALWNVHERARFTAQVACDELSHKIEHASFSVEKFTQEFTSSEHQQSGSAAARYLEIQQSLDRLSEEKQQIVSRLLVLDHRLVRDLEHKGNVDLAFVVTRIQECRKALVHFEKEEHHIRTESYNIEHAKAEAHARIQACDEELKTYTHKTPPSPQGAEDLSYDVIRKDIEEIIEFYPSALVPLEEQAGVFQRIVERLRALLMRITRFSEQKRAEAPHAYDTQVTGILQRRDSAQEEFQKIRTAQEIARDRLGRIQKEKEKLLQECGRLEREHDFFSSAKGVATRAEEFTKEKEELLVRQAAIETQSAQASAIHQALLDEEKTHHKALLELQKQITHAQREIEILREQHARHSLDRARAETHQEELLHKICEDLSLDVSLQQEIGNIREAVYTVLGFRQEYIEEHTDELKQELAKLKAKLDAIGAIDAETITEFESTKERYDFLTSQVQDLTSAVASLENTIHELDGIIQEKFDTALSRINEKFQEYFTRLFRGGSAKLVVQKGSSQQEESDQGDEQEPPSNLIVGIDIQVTPPGKKFRNLSVLSGGEKAMTAIALLCAILSCNPSPFVVLDEVDAALDDSNATRFADIVQELATRTQFIVITHNKVTIHTANVFYGVTMGDDGVSRVLSLDTEKIGAIVSS